jgi:two-component system alkaline phosphatase synthesis response regulator PhoP
MRKILIIDDEKEFCSLMKKSLERLADYEVIYANDGKSGMAMARKQSPDLILLDIMMPAIDGLEVLRKLKEDTKTLPIPVVMLTAKSEEAFKIQAAHSFGEDYVTKPVDLDCLKAKIENIFARTGRK